MDLHGEKHGGRDRAIGDVFLLLHELLDAYCPLLPFPPVVTSEVEARRAVAVQSRFGSEPPTNTAAESSRTAENPAPTESRWEVGVIWIVGSTVAGCTTRVSMTYSVNPPAVTEIVST